MQFLTVLREVGAKLPADRWESQKFYDPVGSKLGKMSTFRGGFLDRIDEFDAHFFGISPREAIWLDPQQRLLLECAWEALESAGYSPGTGNDRIGIFAGAGESRYRDLVRGDQGLSELLGEIPSIKANSIFGLIRDFLKGEAKKDTADLAKALDK